MVIATTYKTAQVAKLIGVHPNTIRFYEEMALLPVIPRKTNGYRVFTDRHLLQLRLLRTAFHAEIISGRLRQEAYGIVKTAATDDISGAYLKVQSYHEHLKAEKLCAEEAIQIVTDLIEANERSTGKILKSKRKEVADHLGITADVLRDWERNGLITVPRDINGNRAYGTKEINRLKIIRTLRNAHYSMMAVLRMLNRLDSGDMNIRENIDTPGEDEDIIVAADRYITALCMAATDALHMIGILDEITVYNRAAQGVGPEPKKSSL